MGLFKKKKAAIERAQIEATHEIVCLYCFRNFDHNEVVFRAAQAIDVDGYRAEPDVLLDTYRARFNLNPAGAIAPVLLPGKFKEKNKGYKGGILTTLYDAHNNPTSTRLCPYCHNSLLPSAGFSPNMIIPLTGGSRAGKSTYLTSLVHNLKTVASLNFEMFCTPLNSEVARKFKAEFEDPLLESGYLLNTTPRELPHEPFVFTISFANSTMPEINIVLFDVAVDSAYMDIYAGLMRNSAGMIFLVDPLQFREPAHMIRALNKLNHEGTASEPIEVLGRLVENCIYSPDGVSNIPIATVLTKTDLLVALGHHGEYLHPRSNIFARYVHPGYFDLSQFDAINYEVDAFLQLVDPNFRNALRGRLANLGFFGVSALGTQPELIHKRVAGFAPARVDEPLLWILYKLGYIEGRHVEV